MVTNRQS